jgi:hypothetical protein
VNTQIAAPLGKWYKAAQKKRRDMEAKHLKEAKELASKKVTFVPLQRLYHTCVDVS